MNNKIQSQLIEGLDAQNKGDFELAKKKFHAILKSDAKNFGALYSLVVIELSLGHFKDALSFANRAITSNPTFTQIYYARALAYFQLGDLTNSLKDTRKTLSLDPQFQAAIDLENQIKTASTASNSTALTNTVTPTFANHPNSSDQTEAARLNALAAKSLENGKTDEAAQYLQQSLEKIPENFFALYTLGFIYQSKGETKRALEFLDRATKSQPNSELAFFALATVQHASGLLEDALESFDRAIAINPRYIDAYNNKVSLLHAMNRQLDALHTLEAALLVAPKDEKILNNKGYLLTEFKQNAAAADVFQQVIQLNPDFEYVQGLHMFARLHACDWRYYEENKQIIIDGVRAGKRVVNPLAFMAISDSAEDQSRCVEIFGKHKYPAQSQPLWKGEKYLHRKKRVAFISADFREHPVGYLLVNLIETLDKARIESYGIFVGLRDDSELYKRYRLGFDQYLDCADKPAVEIAKILKNLEIDIAIDLSGYTSGSRLDVLSYRPAPIQMTYLGFPGSLGLPYVDYIIADKVVIPEALQHFYSEKVLYLDDCYLPRDLSVQPSADTPSKESQGLPSTGTVLCSFNHDYKINPPVFSAWMDILHEIKGSALWLMRLNDDAKENLKLEATRRDIDPNRLVFATRVPKVEDHLARYRLADLCLDTYPYNGHTTTSDAVYAGRPVLSVSGTSFASRVASSVLWHQNPNYKAVPTIADLKRHVLDELNENTSILKTNSSVFVPRIPAWTFSDLILSAQ
jgi:predicted O-linked N-acetylglucosamine transferase (SPINDLY family)